jgi:Zn-finger nucleic acid-binding protein
MATELECPRCWPWGELAPGVSDLPDFVCRQCHGRLCLQESTEALLVQEQGITLGELRQATKTLVEGKRRCPNCKKAMSLVHVNKADVEICFDCGASWFDKGELAQVSGDRHGEPAPRPVVVGDDHWDMFQETAQRIRENEIREASRKRWTAFFLLLAACAGAAWKVLW